MKNLLRAVWAIDLWLAALLTFATVLVLSATTRDLESTSWVAGATISAGFVLAGVNIVSMRWVSDRAKGSAYGELIRYIDPAESNVSQPYWIVTVACFVLSGLGILGFVVDGELSRQWTVAYFAALVFFAAYALFGSLSLLRLTRWHQRKSALLQAAEEEGARLDRERAGPGAGAGNDGSDPAQT